MRMAFQIAVSLLLAAPAHADTLFERLGGMDMITRISERTIDIAAADPLIGPHWEESNLVRVKAKLAEQICELSGGPCKYSGNDMVQVHKPFKFTNADFNRLVENLQQAMDESGVDHATQNRLLALLAPMQREIVTR
ncbi:group I truncated hemoglobin [Pseudokordiimonas caeni]|uniref:group I truncated hemoglobin n=1 Tax=Pseudokordiimonas caeni TaxID=2997908 RepID=UPI0028125E44|nr:group 1 truncated hemoglobin [Pseudokordiimonas caeni]